MANTAIIHFCFKKKKIKVEFYTITAIETDIEHIKMETL